MGRAPVAASKLGDGVTYSQTGYPGTGKDKAVTKRQQQLHSLPLPRANREAKGARKGPAHGPNMYEQMGDGAQEHGGVLPERDPVMHDFMKIRDGANNGG
jgi:hypothetical protein